MGLLDDITIGLVPKTVGVHEFAESTEYCNQALFPRQTALLKLMFLEEMTGAEEDILSEWIESSKSGGEVLLSPNIRERRDYLRERGYKHFREIQLVGGRRSSKGFMTGIAMAKTMWDTLQLGDPHEHYGISRTREIYFSCVAASESQAKEFQYGDLVGTVEGCKAFEPYLQKSLETEFRVATPSDLRRISAAKARSGKIERDTSKLRGKALAANAGTLRGSATMTVAMDEMAHMTVGESKASAKEVYGAAIPSLSQFGIDGMIFANSSPYTKVGKFYEIFEVAMRSFDPKRSVALSSVGTTGVSEDGEVDMTVNGDPRMFSFEYPSWELYKGYRKYKSKWKQRERGREIGKMPTASPDWDPEELDADGDPLYGEEDKEFIFSQRNTEAADPEVFKVEQRGQFAEVIDSFLIPGLVDRMYQGIPKGLEVNANGDQVMTYTPLHTNFGNGALNTNRYKFHLDPSSTTAGFGFAIGHIEYFVDPSTGEEAEHAVFDLIKRWDPKSFPGRVIRWKPILDEVAMYADIFRPYEITFDQHQCLAEDALINTSKGLVPIGEIGSGLAPGEGRRLSIPVFSHHDSDAVATYIYRRGESPTKQIEVKGGYQIEATLDHRLWVRDAKEKAWHPYPEPHWKFVKDIKVGDQLLVKPGSVADNEYQSVASAQFERHRNCPIKRLPDVMDEDLGAYFGWIISEGYVPIEPARHSGCFTNSEPEALKDFVRLSERLFGHTPKLVPRDESQSILTYSARLPRSVNRFLNNLGVAGPSHLKVIPDVLFRSPSSVIRAFLQRLFDGDGSIAIRRANDVEIIYSTESPALARGLQQLLLREGIFTTLYQDPHDPEKREHPLWRVKLFGRHIVNFMGQIGLVSERKGAMGVQAAAIASQLTNVRDNRSFDGEALWKKVIEIQDSTADCYDLSVPGEESFVANGIVSHNSAEPIQTLQEKLRARNIICMVHEQVATNESNWKGWQVLKTAIYQGLVHAPFDEGNWNDPTSQNELKFLQQMPTGGKYPKVEKQDIGPVRTKDQADCIREVVHGLIGNIMATRARERLSTPAAFGGQGGYGLGQGSSMYSPGGSPVGISDYYASRPDRIGARGDRGMREMDRSSLTRSALGGRGRHQGGRSRGRGF